MSVNNAEKWVRRGGAVWVLIAGVAVYSGIISGSRRERGLTTEGTPEAAQLFLSGSPRVLAPITLFSLWVLRLLWRPICSCVPDRVRRILLVVGSMLYFPGIALMLWGRVTMGKMHNVSTVAGAQLYADHKLITTGPFSLVRHPMYVGGIMAELGALLLYRTWTALLIVINIPVLPARAKREEALLAARFGAEWEEYSRRVPAWLPRGCGGRRVKSEG